MAAATIDRGAVTSPDAPEPDRRADALRANLKRRKAQVRARAEAHRDDHRSDGRAAPGAPAGDA